MSIEVDLDEDWDDPPESLQPETGPFQYTGSGYTGHGDHYVVETDYDAGTVAVHGTLDAAAPGTVLTGTDELVLQYAAEAIGGEYQYGSPVNRLLNGELDSAGRVAGALEHDTDGLTLTGPLADDAPPLPGTAQGAGPRFSGNPAFLEETAWKGYGDEGRSFAYCGEAVDASFTGMTSLHAHARRNFVPASPSVTLSVKDADLLDDGSGEHDALLLEWIADNAAGDVTTDWLEDALVIETAPGEG